MKLPRLADLPLDAANRLVGPDGVREAASPSGVRAKAPPHVMVVAPVSLRRSILARALVQRGYDVSPASDLPQFAGILSTVAAVDVVIVDPAVADLRRLVEIAPPDLVRGWILWAAAPDVDAAAELPPPSVSFRHDAMSRLLLEAIDGMLSRRDDE